ncbi:hypothetical protein ABCV69_004578 [Pseudomonas aeruginosa]|uniref:hypothetical protein n=1 Tax=Pseudomonas aeruginosa TaxID=287 RepID=UPI0005B55BC3|nr:MULTISPECIES: hypothetical protein [Pseudomonadaceae]EKY4114513.1 hypothetical protein [Pseudomonas aeruginosa]ELJ2277916.1 hypothetical protein [Pseudomonas aeruginosa]KJS79097.1 MAG: hypothetical protein JL55_13880 [[Pseudomonas] sp. BICA1-14]MBS2052401.1 hypothetical protein [Pseudomonas aeruginosa]HBP0221283.1 hypothetical protein [Pseudomonas aeruginosa]
MNGKLRLTAVLLGLVAPLLTSAGTLPLCAEDAAQKSAVESLLFEAVMLQELGDPPIEATCTFYANRAAFLASALKANRGDRWLAVNQFLNGHAVPNDPKTRRVRTFYESKTSDQ